MTNLAYSLRLGSGVTTSRKPLSPTQMAFFHLCFVICPGQFVTALLYRFMIVVGWLCLPTRLSHGQACVVFSASCTSHRAWHLHVLGQTGKSAHPTLLPGHRTGTSHHLQIILIASRLRVRTSLADWAQEGARGQVWF